MTTQITTSTASTATAYSNQRKIDRTSNGVLWAHIHETGTHSQMWFSTDNGATWTLDTGVLPGTGTATYIANSSFFIDQDDYAHVAYKNAADGYIYYRRGTPNASRTAWTWSAATRIQTGASYDCPDLVAHREGTGWVVHVVIGQGSGGAGSANNTYYVRIDIDSAGVISAATSVSISNNYGAGVNTYPCIDFNHTGDGKTVKDGTPNLYVAWSAGKSGAGFGIRFKKATYSAGAWTWGTEREIDNTRFWNSTYPSNWLNCLFDGTRVIIGGKLRISSTDDDLVLYERDEGDTNTIVHVLLNDAPNTMEYGSLSYDADGNVYLLGRHYDGVGQTVSYRKWDQALDSLGPVILIANTSTAGVYCSAKRGYSDSKIEFVYTDGSASPYSVVYDSITLNQLPNAPDISSASWANGQLNINYVHNDPDNDPQSKRQFRYRKAVV